jgi:hypothetical protein
MPQLTKQSRKKYAFHDRGSTRIRDVISFLALFFLGFVAYECIICYVAFSGTQVTAAPTAIVAPTEQPTDIAVPLGTPLYQTMYVPTAVPTERPTFPPMGLSTVPQPTKAPTPVQSTPIQPTPVPTSLPQPTPTPTSTGTWTTVYSYSGNGNKQTPTISVPADWQIVYTCSGDTMADGALGVIVTNSDGTPADTAVSATCIVGKTTSGMTEVHYTGKVFLNIIATSSWTIQVQEMV